MCLFLKIRTAKKNYLKGIAESFWRNNWRIALKCLLLQYRAIFSITVRHEISYRNTRL